MKRLMDYLVSVVSPTAGVRRANARRLERSYRGGESNRLTAHNKPKNQAADTELQGPYGADSLRAWARMLVRDNPYAWSALEAIVSEVIGSGFVFQSALETTDGQDEPDTNENRDKTWLDWCEVCDLNGELTFDEIQVLAFREMVEAGECLIRYLTVPLKHNGILRPVPLALELIESDRLASDFDSYALNRDREGVRITRGVEMDATGRPIAYWIYPAHPTEPNVFRRTPKRIPASEIEHLYRKDRIGQSRGVTWYAPIISMLRDLGTYVENELQASAVASCFVAAIKSDRPIKLNNPPSVDDDVSDSDGNEYGHIQPGMFTQLQPHESIDFGNPGRPNSNAGPWISLMLQGLAAGTGTSYESVSKDFSNTSYSSSRTSKLENRPRYRRWQNYWKSHLCQPTWDRFCEAAAFAGREEFPSMFELLDDRRSASPVEFMTPEWEWVDIQAEQQANEAAVAAHQKTGTGVAGSMGGNYRAIQRKLAQEKAYRKKLGVEFDVDMTTPAEAASKQAEGTGNQANAMAVQALAASPDQSRPVPTSPDQSINPSGKLTVMEALQKIYLSVGKVITEDEARKIIQEEYGYELPPGKVGAENA